MGHLRLGQSSALIIALAITALPARAQEFTSAYVGGRGILTVQGPTGLFLNPTSGTAPGRSLTAQICAATVKIGDSTTATAANVLATYGATDWLEVGAIAYDIQNDGQSPGVGPHVRARLVTDQAGSAIPEIGVGYYSNEGRTAEKQRSFFAAASKQVAFDQTSAVRSIRFHGGVRNTWRKATDDSEVVGYGGVELELPYYVFLGAELSTDEDPFERTPFGFGLQVRHPSGVGFTLSGVQPGFSDDIALFIGIGINFKN